MPKTSAILWAPYGGKTASPKKEGEISFCSVLRIWVAVLIDVTLTLAVTNVRAPPFNRAAACGAMPGVVGYW